MRDILRKLLVVDDDPGICTQLWWYVDRHEVYTANNQECALELFEQHFPPVVTLDFGLRPDKYGITDGYKILEQILDKAPKTQIIVASGSDEKENRVRTIESGAFEFYAKPYRPEQRSEIIEQAYKDYKKSKLIKYIRSHFWSENSMARINGIESVQQQLFRFLC